MWALAPSCMKIVPWIALRNGSTYGLSGCQLSNFPGSLAGCLLCDLRWLRDMTKLCKVKTGGDHVLFIPSGTICKSVACLFLSNNIPDKCENPPSEKCSIKEIRVIQIYFPSSMKCLMFLNAATNSFNLSTYFFNCSSKTKSLRIPSYLTRKCRNLEIYTTTYEENNEKLPL